MCGKKVFREKKRKNERGIKKMKEKERENCVRDRQRERM